MSDCPYECKDITECDNCGKCCKHWPCSCPMHDDPEEPQERHYKTHQRAVKSDGGPTGYYDFPPNCATLNDLLEWLAVERWGKFSLHMKDIMKAGFRFGGKEGTEQEYDANKIIYFGCRLLVMVSGKEKVREYLKKLLDDPQFK